MSTIWTPSGEHTPREDPAAAGAPPAAATPAAGHPGEPEAPGDLSPEEVAAIRRLHEELRATPAVDVLANHAIQIFQLALVYLGVATPPDESGRPPLADLANAGIAIDAMAALIDGLGPRLGDHETPLRDGLTEIQMLFVRVADAAGGHETP
ncbi:MAG: DUF1844 domain-containing protein [Acidimicrobiia bacterium]|nr:DUF1844 domain-containing protein [Acidimicrobiia bacterium]